jgi:hypothetical protein
MAVPSLWSGLVRTPASTRAGPFARLKARATLVLRPHHNMQDYLQQHKLVVGQARIEPCKEMLKRTR